MPGSCVLANSSVSIERIDSGKAWLTKLPHTPPPKDSGSCLLKGGLTGLWGSGFSIISQGFPVAYWGGVGELMEAGERFIAFPLLHSVPFNVLLKYLSKAIGIYMKGKNKSCKAATPGW